MRCRLSLPYAALKPGTALISVMLRGTGIPFAQMQHDAASPPAARSTPRQHGAESTLQTTSFATAFASAGGLASILETESDIEDSRSWPRDFQVGKANCAACLLAPGSHMLRLHCGYRNVCMPAVPAP